MLAVVLGKLIGSVTVGNPYLSWLGTSANFGFPSVPIDLAVVTFTFGIMISINVAQAILLLLAILVYTVIKIRD